MKPKSMKVFSVLNFILAGIYFIWTISTLLMSNVLFSNSHFNNDAQSGTIALVMILTIPLNLCLITLAIVSGIGLSKVATWGRGWTIALAVSYLIINVIKFFIGFVFRSGIDSLSAVPIVLSIADTICWSAYPVILLLFLNTTKWKLALSVDKSNVG